MNKRRIYFLILTAFLISLIAVFRINKKIKEQKAQITYPVQKGTLSITVNSTGELESETSTRIQIPSDELRSIEIWEIKLASLLPEGTLIDSGMIVADIDPSVVSEKLIEVENNIAELRSQLVNSKADTALELSALRDDILNQKHQIKEYELILKQSKYESPSVIKQAELTLDKSKRTLVQQERNYDLKVMKSKTSVMQIINRVHHIERKKQRIQGVLNKMQIKSPGKGMLIYYKDMMGNSIKEGSKIQVFGDNTIALIPNFASMISKTYINEIEISKLKVGQKVCVGIDAYPNERYTGSVIKLSSVGEKLEGSSTKVFKVLIRLDSVNSYLKPGMTTSNQVIVDTFQNRLYVPLESIHNEKGKNYVFQNKRHKVFKKEVILGEMNDNFITIEDGLGENDKVLLNIPENAGRMEVVEL